MAVKIAAIADVHYRKTDLESSTPRRRYAIADILLLRAIERLNRFIRPDVTLLLGDLIDQGGEPTARGDLEHVRSIIDRLESPAIILPGNHDGDIDAFYSIFPKPDDTIDIGGVRFVQFLDPEEPHYNSHRTPQDLKRMAAARSGWDGPLISVQHVPLFPPGASTCPYHLLNDEETLNVFRENGYTMAISGHYHEGDDLYTRGAGDAVIAPALCQPPFAFVEINIDGDRIDVKRHELSMPRDLGLIDYHIHTPYAYCQENMDMQMSLDLADELGIERIGFSEHSSHLYFSRDTYRKLEWLREGIDLTEGRHDLVGEYLSKARLFESRAYIGLEIDSDYSGRQVMVPQDLDGVQVRIGALHKLAELIRPIELGRDKDRAVDEFLGCMSKFIGSGIDILAHPFRVFRRGKMELPMEVIGPTVRLLKQHNVAAEINFHTNDPRPEFVKACVEQGVKLTFGSDSHNLCEVGEFYPHLQLLRSCGYTDSDLPAILAGPADIIKR